VSRDLLYRSSVFKVLLYFFICVGVIYSLLVHQVFLSSESFHRGQLERELAAEAEMIKQLAHNDEALVRNLIVQRRNQDSPFSYQLIPTQISEHSSNSYPLVLTGGRTDTVFDSLHDGQILIGNNQQLIIGISPELLASYRESVMPMMVSGVLIPVILMLISAAFFSVSIISKLQRVNQAMNRVLCGEKHVKLPVSCNDDEFDILAIHLNFMIEQMEKKEASLKALTVGMAHDMRTPIARMKLRLDSMLVESEELHKNKLAELEACHDDLEVLLSLFNGMLEIANLNSGNVSIAKQPVNLTQICMDTCDFLQPLADEKEQIITLREDANYILCGEPSLLFRALFNLVENAIKYTPREGEIEITVDHYGVVVSDNGYGIPNVEKERVCEPMYRCDSSRSEQGAGLGLSLVQAVVQRHGGDLVLGDNSPGLRVRLMFPCVNVTRT